MPLLQSVGKKTVWMIVALPQIRVLNQNSQRDSGSEALARQEVFQKMPKKVGMKSLSETCKVEGAPIALA